MANKPDRTELERLLSSYIDGACSDAEQQIVEAALASDPKLRELHRQLLRTVECVKGVGAEAPPGHLRERILSQMERHALLDGGRPVSHGSRSLLPLMAMSVAAAAVLVAAVTAGWWFYTNREPTAGHGILMADRSHARPGPNDLPEESPRLALRSEAPPLPSPVSGLTSNVTVPADNERNATDTAVREAAGKALVARQVAAQEVAVAQAASEKAAARVAAAQAAAQHLATIKAAASQPESSELAARPASPPLMVYNGNAGADRPAMVAGISAGRQPQVAPEIDQSGYREQTNTDVSGLSESVVPMAALEILGNAHAADRPVVMRAVEMAVRQIGGRIVALAAGADSSTVIAMVPADKRHLLGSEVSEIEGMRDVALQELAMDATSLEVEAMTSGAKVTWVPGRWQACLSWSTVPHAPEFLGGKVATSLEGTAAAPAESFAGAAPVESQQGADRRVLHPASPAGATDQVPFVAVRIVIRDQ